jgi:hypothetical protein
MRAETGRNKFHLTVDSAASNGLATFTFANLVSGIRDDYGGITSIRTAFFIFQVSSRVFSTI